MSTKAVGRPRWARVQRWWDVRSRYFARLPRISRRLLAQGALVLGLGVGSASLVAAGAPPASRPAAAPLPAAYQTIYGAQADDRSGRSVSDVGDFNGDGRPDLLIGAPNADGPGNSRANAGEIYVVFGKASPPSVEDLSNPDMVIYGPQAYDWIGYSLSRAGDFNADGFDDIIIGGQWVSDIG